MVLLLVNWQCNLQSDLKYIVENDYAIGVLSRTIFSYILLDDDDDVS